jgi:hypothetical protein
MLKVITLSFEEEHDPYFEYTEEECDDSRFVSSEVRTVSETGGEKGQKLARFDLIPPESLWQLAEAYGVGAQKYAERNWERGYSWSLSYAAMQRHANQFWTGEDYDEESQIAHMASVAWHAFAMLYFMSNYEHYGVYDDRSTRVNDEK